MASDGDAAQRPLGGIVGHAQAAMVAEYEANRAKARIGIRWHTGAADEIVIDRPRPTGVPAPTPTPATALIRELGPVTSDPNLVTLLAQRGYRTGAGRPFDIKAVQWVRHAYQIPSPSPCRDTEISVAEAAFGSAAAPASSTTGSKPGSWTPAAAQAAGCASPGPRPPMRTAVPASPSSGHLNPAARRTRPRQHR